MSRRRAQQGEGVTKDVDDQAIESVQTLHRRLREATSKCDRGVRLSRHGNDEYAVTHCLPSRLPGQSHESLQTNVASSQVRRWRVFLADQECWNSVEAREEGIERHETVVAASHCRISLSRPRTPCSRGFQSGPSLVPASAPSAFASPHPRPLACASSAALVFSSAWAPAPAQTQPWALVTPSTTSPRLHTSGEIP